MNWQLNKIQFPVYNLGPGKRIGIWVQGCSIKCNGCINKSTWNPNGGKAVKVLKVFDFIQSKVEDFDGITVTGGEPFNQYKQLMAFSMLIKRKAKLNILCYSGYTLNELEVMFPDKAFYKCLDYLIDGQFIENNQSNNSIKGSDKQNIYRFVNGKPQLISLRNEDEKWSLKQEGDTIYMSGIPKGNNLKGILKDFSNEQFNMEIV